MTDSDRTIRVLCSFEISDQTITLAQKEEDDQGQGGVGDTYHRYNSNAALATGMGMQAPTGIDVS